MSLVVFVFVAGLIFRLLPIFLWKRDPTDIWFNYYRIKLFRENGGLPEFTPNIDPPTLMAYPWGLTWFFSRLRFKDPLLAGASLNVFITMLELSSAGFLVWFISGKLNLEIDQFQASATAMGIYASLPLVLNSRSGVFSLTARPLGAFLVGFSIVTIILGIEFGGWLWLPIPLLAGWLLVFTSKFGVQAFCFSCLGLSFFTMDVRPFAIFLLSLIVALVLGRVDAFKIMRGHLLHMRFYCSFLQYRHIATLFRTWTFQEWFKIAIKTFSPRKTLEAGYKTPLIRSFFFNPWLFFLPAILISPAGSIPIIVKLLWLPFLGILLTLLFTWRHLRFLGEADRYQSFFGMLSLSVAIGISIPLVNWWIPYWIMIVATVLISCFFIMENVKRAPQTDWSKKQELISFLNNDLAENARVIIIPTNLSGGFLPFTNCTFVGVYSGILELPNQARLASLYPKYYPYPELDFDKLNEEWGIDYVIYSKRHCSNAYLKNINIDFGNLNVPSTKSVFENEMFSVYSLADGKH